MLPLTINICPRLVRCVVGRWQNTLSMFLRGESGVFFKPLLNEQGGGTNVVTNNL